MKLKFFIVSVALCLFNLNAVDAATSSSAADAPPTFAFNPEGLAKPAAMKCMQWIDVLETERNKADCIGNFQAFKAFSKEISATIGGKYGISSRRATPEEAMALSYSITRTRHKFCGKRNMLTDFYGAGEVGGLESHHKGHLAAVLGIDTMVTKAMDDEDFADQWSAVKPNTPAAESFINAVKASAQLQEKGSLVAALEQSLMSFLRTRQEVIATAKEVFDVFAPKLSLNKIYDKQIVSREMYRGWAVEGAKAFTYPVNLTAEENADNPGLESILRAGCIKDLGDGYSFDVYCRSAIASFVSGDVTNKISIQDIMLLEYVYYECLDEFFVGRIRGEGPRRLFLSRTTNSSLVGTLRKYHYKISEDKLLNIHRYLSVCMCKSLTERLLSDELALLVALGNPTAIRVYAVGLFNDVIGIERNVPKAIKLLREAADLGDDFAVKNLPNFLSDYAVWLFDGENGISRDIPKAFELYREAASFGHVEAQRNLRISLSEYARWLFDGENGIKQNIPKAIDTFREAAVLGEEYAERNLASALSKYADFLSKGEEGVEKDMSKAINMCRDAVDLGDEDAIINLPKYLSNYGAWLFFGKNGIEKDIPRAIDVCREAVILGSADARRNFPKLVSSFSFSLFHGSDGIEKNIPKAIEMCREAADLGNENAISNLHKMLSRYSDWLLKGQNGIKKDIPKAIECCREAAALSDEDAIRNLPIILNKYALALFDGKDGIAVDLPKAIEIFREASDLGGEHAKLNLPTFLNNYAFWLFNGDNDVEKDMPKAIEMCKEAKSLRNRSAETNLPIFLLNYAVCLFRGENGIEQNFAMAVKVCREAAELGNEEAIANLPTMLAAMH